MGTAASPVGGDEIGIRVTVGPGAHLVVRSAASTIAWASRGARLHVEVDVAAGGCLDWGLRPLVASGGCQYTQEAAVNLAPGAELRWAEEVVLGRHNEEPGDLDLRLDVDWDGLAMLRHRLVVGPAAHGWDGPAVLGHARAVATHLVAGAGPGRRTAAGAGWALMALDGPATLAQAVGTDLAEARSRMAEAWAP